MKSFLCVLLILTAFISSSRCEDVLVIGVWHKNARVMSASAGRAKISSASGEATVPINSLPRGLRKEAEEMVRSAAADAEANAAHEKKMAEGQAQIDAIFAEQQKKWHP